MKQFLNDYKDRQNFKVKWIIIPLLTFVMGITFAYVLGFIISSVSLMESILSLLPKQNLSGVNILAVGVDSTKKVKRSDTIIVIHLNKQSNRLGVLSIPRDTRTEVDGYGMTKINHAYAHGGIKLLKKTVSSFLNIPINYHVVLDINAVKDIVDHIGGVSVDVEKDLYYVDQAGDLFINLKKGKQHLDGEKTIEYLRFRHDNDGDIGRINRQQTFVTQLITSIKGQNTFFEIPLIMKKLKKV